MKKWLIILMCLMMVGCAPRIAVRTDYNLSKIKRVAVLPFEPRGSSLSVFYTDWFTTELVRIQKFEVVERAQLDKVLSEQALGLSGVINRDVLVKIGQVLGVDAVFLGSATKGQTGGGVCNIRLVDIETGVIIWTGTSSDVRHLTKDLAKRLK